MTEFNNQEPVIPRILLFGESGASERIRSILSPLAQSGGDAPVDVVPLASADDLCKEASDAILVIVAVRNSADWACAIPEKLSLDRDVVCSVLGIALECDLEERLRIMARGFDAVFDEDTLNSGEFKKIFANKIAKGFIRLRNRVQVAEYSRLQAALSAGAEAYIVFDGEKKLAFVSDHYRKAYPLSAGRLVRGLDVLDAFEMLCIEEGVTKGDERYEAMRRFWGSLEGQSEYTMNDGRICRVKARRLPDGQGTIVTTSDITNYKYQQKELERKSGELSDALEKEREASAIQKQFIDMVSHEFRTPLAIIDGSAQSIQRRTEEMDTQTIQARARTIRSAVSRLVNLMEGVLSSNMMETGRLHLVPEPLEIRKLVQELATEHMDISKGRNIECDLEGLPETVVLDRKVVTLVIGNLLANAVKFTQDDAPIRIQGWLGDGSLHVRISDKGIGIPARELDRIFDRYYRASTAHGIPGTGIGLHIVRSLTELHGGTVELQSREGEGTSVCVKLPGVLHVQS